MEVLYPTFNSKLYLKQAREEANPIISAVKEKRNKVTNTMPPIRDQNLKTKNLLLIIPKGSAPSLLSSKRFSRSSMASRR
jgi:hypothetical protein